MEDSSKRASESMSQGLLAKLAAGAIQAQFTQQGLSERPEKLTMQTVQGDSLKGIANHGDTLFVEACANFDQDGVYVLNIDGLIRLRKLRLSFLDGSISVESTNGREPETLRQSDIGRHVKIEGYVVGVGSVRRI